MYDLPCARHCRTKNAAVGAFLEKKHRKRFFSAAIGCGVGDLRFVGSDWRTGRRVTASAARQKRGIESRDKST